MANIAVRIGLVGILNYTFLKIEVISMNINGREGWNLNNIIDIENYQLIVIFLSDVNRSFFGAVPFREAPIYLENKFKFE